MNPIAIKFTFFGPKPYLFLFLCANIALTKIIDNVLGKELYS